MTAITKHYLEAELDQLFQSDTDMWNFVQQASLDGVWYWDLENPDTLWISPEYWKCLGYNPAEKQHSPSEFINVVYKEDLQNILDNLNDHYADPSILYEQTVRFYHADGSTVWVRCRGMATRDSTGKAIRMLGAHNDITNAKLAEERAKKQSEALAAANKIILNKNAELRDFSFSLSHDLRSPILTTTRILDAVLSEKENLSEMQETLLELGAGTVNRMKSLVDSLLDYMKLDHSVTSTELINLAELIELIVSDLNAEITEVKAVVQTSPNLPNFFGDSTQIRILVQNLISNALKYHDSGRQLEIKINPAKEDEKSKISFAVSDNGLGVAPEHQDRIFGLFNRLHREHEIPGTGLGLSICERVATNHNGKISLQSTLGVGSIFTVTLDKGGPNEAPVPDRDSPTNG